MANTNLSQGLGADLVIGKDAVVNTYIAGGTIARAGDLVKFDVSQSGDDRAEYVVAGDASALVFGVALETASSGDLVRVLVEGYVEGLQTDGTVSQGDALAAGAAAEAVPYANTDTLPIIGVALEADAGSDPYTVDAYIFRTVA